MWREIGTFLFLFFIGVALASEHKVELRAISYIESSNGANINHPIVTKGIHKGHRAAGKYGLMPNTVMYLVKDKSLSKYRYLLSLDHREITEEINNDSEMDKEIATNFWIRLRKKFGPRRSAYAWYHGPGRAKNIEQAKMEKSPYVVKFTKEMERLKNEREVKR